MQMFLHDPPEVALFLIVLLRTSTDPFHNEEGVREVLEVISDI